MGNDSVVCWTQQDGELRKAFQRALTKQGLKFKLNTKVKEATTEGNVVKLRVEPSKGGDEELIEADIVLLSAGWPCLPVHLPLIMSSFDHGPFCGKTLKPVLICGTC